MPQMEDPNFRQTLTYIIDHGDHGALGFVINRPVNIDMEEIYKQMAITPSAKAALDTQVLQGGPVDQEHGLVLHRSGPTWIASQDFGHGISLSSSRDVLEALACGEGPQQHLVLLGHSGWGPGQLEDEMAHNAWLNCPAVTDILFASNLDSKLSAAASAIGIDLSQMVADAGHA